MKQILGYVFFQNDTDLTSHWKVYIVLAITNNGNVESYLTARDYTYYFEDDKMIDFSAWISFPVDVATHLIEEKGTKNEGFPAKPVAFLKDNGIFAEGIREKQAQEHFNKLSIIEKDNIVNTYLVNYLEVNPNAADLNEHMKGFFMWYYKEFFTVAFGSGKTFSTLFDDFDLTEMMALSWDEEINGYSEELKKQYLTDHYVNVWDDEEFGLHVEEFTTTGEVYAFQTGLKYRANPSLLTTLSVKDVDILSLVFNMH